MSSLSHFLTFFIQNKLASGVWHHTTVDKCVQGVPIPLPPIHSRTGQCHIPNLYIFKIPHQFQIKHARFQITNFICPLPVTCLLSQGGDQFFFHKRSRGPPKLGPRATSGPRASFWSSLVYGMVPLFGSPVECTNGRNARLKLRRQPLAFKTTSRG